MVPLQGTPQPSGETLFIDARKRGHLIDRTRRDLSPEDIARVADTYHAWRGGQDAGEYEGRSRLLQERDAGGDSQARPRPHARPLRRGRAATDDGVPFEDKMARLAAQWREQQEEAQRLDAAIEENLKGLGFGSNVRVNALIPRSQSQS